MTFGLLLWQPYECILWSCQTECIAPFVCRFVRLTAMKSSCWLPYSWANQCCPVHMIHVSTLTTTAPVWGNRSREWFSEQTSGLLHWQCSGKFWLWYGKLHFLILLAKMCEYKNTKGCLFSLGLKFLPEKPISQGVKHTVLTFDWLWAIIQDIAVLRRDFSGQKPTRAETGGFPDVC